MKETTLRAELRTKEVVKSDLLEGHGKLLDKDDKGVADALIYLLIDEEIEDETFTDSRGVFQIDYNVHGMDVGEYQLELKYVGDDEYEDSSYETTFEIVSDDGRKVLRGAYRKLKE